MPAPPRPSDEVNQASDLAQRLGELGAKITALHRAEKEPFTRTAGARSTANGLAARYAAAFKARLKAVVVTPFLVARDKAAKAAAAKAIAAGTAPADLPAAAHHCRHHQTRDRAAHADAAEVVDWDALTCALHQHTEIRALAQKIANALGQGRHRFSWDHNRQNTGGCLMNDQTKLPALITGGRVAAIIPQNFEDAWRIGRAVIEAGMAPRGVTTPAMATVIILHGLEVGLTPMAALQSIGLINGKPCLYGDGLLGVVRASGVFEWIKEELTDGVASCIVKRRGEEPLERTFSEADAKLAGLWGKRTTKGEPTPWITYPQRMLAMRARAFALRDAFADVLKGIAPREEVEDWNGGAGRPHDGDASAGRRGWLRARTLEPARPPSRRRTRARPSRRRRPAHRGAARPGNRRDHGSVTIGGQEVGARILTDAELVAELEAGRDDGGTVEWHEEEPPTEATAEDVLDVSTLLARVEHAYSECHNLTRLHQVKDTLVMPVIEHIFPPTGPC